MQSVFEVVVSVSIGPQFGMNSVACARHTPSLCTRQHALMPALPCEPDQGLKEHTCSTSLELLSTVCRARASVGGRGSRWVVR